MKEIEAKTLLSRTRDQYFGFSYTMNLYRGCQHGCIYCDSRSACYQKEDFSDIEIKANSIPLLRSELASKKKKGTIGFGSMSDPYMEIEKTRRLSRQALEVLHEFRFPVHLLTKSELVVRDIDLFKKLSSVYCAISFSFSTPYNSIASKIEPGASLPDRRFAALEQLRKHNIYAGITYMPILPFITDTVKSVKTLVQQAYSAGVCYILPYVGVTLRDGSRDYFYDKLKMLNPSLVQKYKETFGQDYMCHSPREQELYAVFYEQCATYGIATEIDFYSPETGRQLSLF